MIPVQKQPGETKTLAVEFSPPTGVSIASATVATVEVSDGTVVTAAMTPGPVVVESPLVKFAITGGTDGTSYKTTLSATRSDGDVEEVDIVTVVREE